MIHRSCSRCIFWQVQTLERGECRQFSPDVGTVHEQKWPVTMADEWCGQFQAMPYGPGVLLVDEAQRQSWWRRLLGKVNK